jgi:hypothetical protein
VRLDVAHAHAAGVQPEDLLVQAREPRLTLGHELGLERSLAVARGLDAHGPQVGVHRLWCHTVAAVARTAGGRLPARIANGLGQLRAQRRLDHPARELREQPARAGDLLGLQAPEGLLELVRGQ